MPGPIPGMTFFLWLDRNPAYTQCNVSSSSRNEVAVIGAGPAGLMAAEVLAQGGAGVTVYDAMPSAGRKFLMAGRGGLNLTHSEPLPAFLTRYGRAMPQLATAIEAFSPQALREWSEALGSQLSLAPAAGFSRKRSRPRRCCARGCGGLTRWVCNLSCATAGPAGTRMAICCFRHPTDNALSMPAQPCWRLAARAGRGWDLTGSGWKPSRRRA